MPMQIDSAVTLKEGEKLIAAYRDHWFGRVRGWTMGFGLLALPFFFMLPLFSFRAVGIIVFVALVGFGLYMLALTYVEWRGNIFIVTDRRVIDIDRRGFLNKIVSEAPYGRVQDVSYGLTGIAGTILGCGTVTVRTGMGAIGLEIRFVKDPQSVHDAITDALSAALGLTGASSGAKKVGALMDAADALDDTEAQALMTALKSRVADRSDGPDAGGDGPGEPVADKDLQWYRDDADV